MAKNLQSITELMLRGYNDRIPAELVPKYYLADLKNGFINAGKIEKRKGYTIVGNDLGSVACQGIRGVEFADGTKEIIVVINGNIYKWTGSGNLTLITGGSGVLKTTGYVDIVVANNNVYFFDANNTVPKYDKTSITTVAAIPKGAFAKWFHNFLFVAGVASTPNTLHVSTLANPEAGYTSADNILVNPNDGDILTGLGVLKDELVTFKRQRIWSITGFGTSQFTVADLNERITGYGTQAYRSIVPFGNDLIYMSFLGDTPHMRSLQRTRYGTTVDGGIISLNIEGSMNGLNTSRLDLPAGIFDGRKLRMACPNSGSSDNNTEFIYDIQAKGWSRTTGINASQYTSFGISTTPQIYFGEASSDSKIYVFDNSKNDNGSAIDFQAKTRRYGAEQANLKKKYRYLWVTADESGNHNLDINYSVDGFTDVALGSINLGTTGSEFDNIILGTSRVGSTDMTNQRIDIGIQPCRFFQLLFKNGNVNEDVAIRQWILMFYNKGHRSSVPNPN